MKEWKGVGRGGVGFGDLNGFGGGGYRWLTDCGNKRKTNNETVNFLLYSQSTPCEHIIHVSARHYSTSFQHRPAQVIIFKASGESCPEQNNSEIFSSREETSEEKSLSEILLMKQRNIKQETSQNSSTNTHAFNMPLPSLTAPNGQQGRLQSDR